MIFLNIEVKYREVHIVYTAQLIFTNTVQLTSIQIMKEYYHHPKTSPIHPTERTGVFVYFDPCYIPNT